MAAAAGPCRSGNGPTAGSPFDPDFTTAEAARHSIHSATRWAQFGAGSAEDIRHLQVDRDAVLSAPAK